MASSTGARGAGSVGAAGGHAARPEPELTRPARGVNVLGRWSLHSGGLLHRGTEAPFPWTGLVPPYPLGLVRAELRPLKIHMLQP